MGQTKYRIVKMTYQGGKVSWIIQKQTKLFLFGKIWQTYRGYLNLDSGREVKEFSYYGYNIDFHTLEEAKSELSIIRQIDEKKTLDELNKELVKTEVVLETE